MTPDEVVAEEHDGATAVVQEILLDLLARTADDMTWLQLSPDEVSELQGALWQAMERSDENEARVAVLRAGLAVLLEGTA